MKNLLKRIAAFAAVAVLTAGVIATPFTAHAAETSEEVVITDAGSNENDVTSAKAYAAGIAIAAAAGLGAIGMGIVVAKSNEGIARQPEAEGKIRTSMMLGLVFVETAIIYALVVAILIIFVL